MSVIVGDNLPTLTSSRVALRWLELADAPALYEIFSDPHVMRYWSTTAWTDVSQGIKLVEDIRGCFAERSLYEWGVVSRKDDSIIGTCTLDHLDIQNRRAEIGFVLRKDLWGRGYMSEALRTLLRFAFEELALHRIEADVDPHNEASIRLLERLGFQREGCLRERWFVGEEINDTVFFGLLRHEWRDA